MFFLIINDHLTKLLQSVITNQPVPLGIIKLLSGRQGKSASRHSTGKYETYFTKCSKDDNIIDETKRFWIILFSYWVEIRTTTGFADVDDWNEKAILWKTEFSYYRNFCIPVEQFENSWGWMNAGSVFSNVRLCGK